MLNIDRVWARQAGRFMGGKKLTDYRIQVITKTYSLQGSASSDNNPVDFGAGAVIIGVIAAAQISAAAATSIYRPGLDLFTVSTSYQADNRVVVGTSQILGSCLFGPYGDQFPGMEIPMPQNTALVYNFTNVTTTAITISLAHHCLMPGAVA